MHARTHLLSRCSFSMGMWALLLLLLLIGDANTQVTDNAPSTFAEIPLQCEGEGPTRHCAAVCEGSSCDHQRFQCPADTKCSLECSSYMSCFDIPVFAMSNAIVNVSCDGPFSCSRMGQFIIQEGGQILTACVGRSSCAVSRFLYEGYDPVVDQRSLIALNCTGENACADTYIDSCGDPKDLRACPHFRQPILGLFDLQALGTRLRTSLIHLFRSHNMTVSNAFMNIQGELLGYDSLTPEDELTSELTAHDVYWMGLIGNILSNGAGSSILTKESPRIYSIRPSTPGGFSPFYQTFIRGLVNPFVGYNTTEELSEITQFVDGIYGRLDIKLRTTEESFVNIPAEVLRNVVDILFSTISNVDRDLCPPITSANGTLDTSKDPPVNRVDIVLESFSPPDCGIASPFYPACCDTFTNTWISSGDLELAEPQIAAESKFNHTGSVTISTTISVETSLYLLKDVSIISEDSGVPMTFSRDTSSGFYVEKHSNVTANDISSSNSVILIDSGSSLSAHSLTMDNSLLSLSVNSSFTIGGCIQLKGVVSVPDLTLEQFEGDKSPILLTYDPSCNCGGTACGDFIVDLPSLSEADAQCIQPEFSSGSMFLVYTCNGEQATDNTGTIVGVIVAVLLVVCVVVFIVVVMKNESLKQKVMPWRYKGTYKAEAVPS